MIERTNGHVVTGLIVLVIVIKVMNVQGRLALARRVVLTLIETSSAPILCLSERGGPTQFKRTIGALRLGIVNAERSAFDANG